MSETGYATTDKELLIEQILQMLKDGLEMHIAIDSSVDHGEAWTPDYTEGYIDGLKRALYLLPELLDELE